MSSCKHCMEGIVLNPECDKVISKYYCAIDAYDKETGCANYPYKTKKRGEVMITCCDDKCAQDNDCQVGGIQCDVCMDYFLPC